MLMREGIPGVVVLGGLEAEEAEAEAEAARIEADVWGGFLVLEPREELLNNFL